ncbi:MAG: polysaccharide pyruvyl transferase family protein [Rhodocyclaceae bacterium]|jgi:hypothetical protein|nr:polysaccharide pyruvyl transferase family protein [Rhodocyclaceae bacterium]
MNISIVGAFDRMNFGDILFPMVLTEYIRRATYSDINIAYYGHAAADLTAYGGYRTRPIRELLARRNKNGENPVILAGGETLGASWNDVLYHLAGTIPRWQKIAKSIGGEYMENYMIRKKLGCSNYFPYLFTPSDFNQNQPVIYNAVGGSSLTKRPDPFRKAVAKTLAQATYISVRDKKTVEILANAGLPQGMAHLTPDSAAVISSLFPADQLEPYLSPEFCSISKSLKGKPYIAFQAGLNFAKDHVKTIASEIMELSSKTGYAILLLPIGRAPGHEDQTILEALARDLGTEAFLPKGNSIFDTLAFIANAELFIGTSLHGAITSMAYSTPHISLTQRDPKVPAYLQTWALPGHRECIEFPDIAKHGIRALEIEKSALLRHSEYLSERAGESLCRIIELL